MQNSAVFEWAKTQYANLGVDVDAAMKLCAETPISLHCWQGDDVLGFEKAGGKLTGGIQATGNYMGRARTPDELRMDLEQALALTPGASKVNLHANYLDTDETPERNELEPRHFERWVQWAVDQGVGLDFNTTFFSHPKGEQGSLSSADAQTRAYWVQHAKQVRQIGAYFGKATGKTCVINHWIHDGAKEVPIDT